MEPGKVVEEQSSGPRHVLIDLDKKSEVENPVVGVNREDTVSWSSERIDKNGPTEVEFFGFEPAEPTDVSATQLSRKDPFVKPPLLTDNLVSKDAPKGLYSYRIHNGETDLGGGTLKIPCDPPGDR